MKLQEIQKKETKKSKGKQNRNKGRRRNNLLEEEYEENVKHE